METHTSDERAYVNVMESLVAQEVGKQLLEVPAKVRRYLKMEEVVTFALNRLPAMYASSERGWQCQRQVAKRDLQRKIQNAVHQAIVAVQVDPLRLSQPINADKNQDAEAVLEALQNLFQLPDLDWAAALKKLDNLKKDSCTLEEFINQQRSAQDLTNQNSPIQQTYRHYQSSLQSVKLSQEVLSQPKEALFGWDNPIYQL